VVTFKPGKEMEERVRLLEAAAAKAALQGQSPTELPETETSVVSSISSVDHQRTLKHALSHQRLSIRLTKLNLPRVLNRDLDRSRGCPVSRQAASRISEDPSKSRRPASRGHHTASESSQFVLSGERRPG